MKGLKIISVIITTTVMTLFISGCYYDVEEELYPTLDCLVSDMSYAQDILPILVADCYACHSVTTNFGNVTIEGHGELIKYVNDGSLLGAVSHEGGYSPMPKNKAKLLDCEIEKIVAWINDGALDN